MRSPTRRVLAVAMGIAAMLAAFDGLHLARSDSNAPLRLLTTIPLPGVRGRLDHLSLDIQNQRLFLAALGNDSVEVLDLARSVRGRSLSGLSNPQGVLYLAKRERLDVANARDGSVRIYDVRSLAMLQSVPYGNDADNLRYDQSTGLIWVGYGEALGTLTSEGVRVADIRLPEHPESFQLESQGPRLFVNLPEAGAVAVVDRQQRAVVTTWQTGFRGNFAMALDERRHRLFVATRRPARLVVMDMQNGRTVATLPTVGDCDDVFVDAKRGRIYLVGGEGAVAIVAENRSDGYRELGRVRTSPGARTGFFSSELDRLYVAVPAHASRPAEVRVFRGADATP